MSQDAALTPAPLGCDEVEPLLPLVADGAIDAAADPAIFEHLARCQDCQDCLARHDLVHLGLERGRTGKMSAMLSMEGWHYRLPWPVAAAALICAVLGLLSWSQGGVPSSQSPANRSASQLVSVPGSNRLDHGNYTYFHGGREELIDLQAVDGAIGEPKPTPVKLDASSRFDR